jgi:hypothetical protein
MLPSIDGFPSRTSLGRPEASTEPRLALASAAGQWRRYGLPCSRTALSLANVCSMVCSRVRRSLSNGRLPPLTRVRSALPQAG